MSASGHADNHAHLPRRIQKRRLPPAVAASANDEGRPKAGQS
jgi:hypothetical protein